MHVTIDHRNAVAPGDQLRSQLVLLIVGGSLSAGERLPSVRQLASDLKLAPGTVARVYKELEASGHVVTSGSGTRVATLGLRAVTERRQHVEEAATSFVATAARAGADVSEALAAVRQAYRQLSSEAV
jgi:DNA-binding transcriptional regulator YhcF (GntR family)